ncbi:MAG: motif family protein [Pseudomonadota bacterium]|jgi:Spy/CpxP family protein refolding chaperone
MKMALSIAALGVLLTSVSVQAQMPPPPPDAPGARAEGPGVEGREIRRIIIRGDHVPGQQGGPRPMLRMQRGGGDLMGAYGLDPRMLMRMADVLELTPQQRGKVTELVETARPVMAKTSRDIRAESQRLRNLDAGDAKYASESASIARKMGELTTSLVQQGAELRGKVWQVLTPDQRKRAENMRDRMRERVKDRIEMHRGKPRALLMEEADEIG